MLSQDIMENIQKVRAGIYESCQKAHRDPSRIEIVAVTKYVDIQRIKKAWDAGLRIFAENYVQEAEIKIASLDIQTQWHLTGHLQKNKIKKAVRLFSMIQTIDSLDLAKKMDTLLQDEEIKVLNKLPVLLEMRARGEKTRYGFDEDMLLPAYEAIKQLPNLEIKGFMMMAPFFDDPEKTRPYFTQMRNVCYDIAKIHHLDTKEMILSMGMSNDYKIAVEGGSTMVRIGTAIFGQRQSMPSKRRMILKR